MEGEGGGEGGIRERGRIEEMIEGEQWVGRKENRGGGDEPL